MKKYEKPKIEVNKINLSDIILESITVKNEIFDFNGPFDETF